MLGMHTIGDLQQCLQATGHDLQIDAPIIGVSIDTRTLQPGECYIALKGEQFDGHDFIREAMAKGASAIIASRKIAANIPVLEVSDTLAALTRIAEFCRQQFMGPVVAITGSCGKTTVKEICRRIFSLAGATLCPLKSFNNHIGLPLTLAQLNATHRFAVLEIGTNHVGEIAARVALAKPSIAVVNNIGPAHLQGFHTLEGVAAEKAAIYQGLMPGGIAVINLDDPFAEYFKHQAKAYTQLTYSAQQSADVMATDIQFNDQACASFVLVTRLGQCGIQLPLPGMHQVHNALAAASLALAAHLPLTVIAEGLATLDAVAGRWQAYIGVNGATIVDDTYNANPKSVAAAMACLQQLPGEHWFVLGDMGELGDDARQLHQQVGRLARDMHIHQLLTVGVLSESASSAFGAGGQHFENKAALIDYLRTKLCDGITLVVKGSRSAKMETIVEALK